MCKFAQFVCVLCVCVASTTSACAQVDGREKLEGAIVLPPLTDFMEGKTFKVRPATAEDEKCDFETELMIGGCSLRIFKLSKGPYQKYLVAGVDTMMSEGTDGVVTLFEGGMTASVVRNGVFLVDVPMNDSLELSFRAVGKKSKIVRETLKGGRHTVFVPEGVLVLKHYPSNPVELKPLPELVIPPAPAPELKGPALPNLEGPVAGEETNPRR